MPVGDTIAGSFGADLLHRYTFRSAGGEYAVFLDVIAGSIDLSVLDSLTGVVRAHVFDAPGPPGLDQVATQNFATDTNRVFILELLRSPNFGGQYRFLVYQVNPAPENRPARFVIGDSVSGSLDRLADVDEFIAAGQAGQEIAGVAYALNNVAASWVSVTVKHPTTDVALGFTTVTAGAVPPAPTTGRLTLPVTGDYRFVVRKAAGAYTGDYAFRFHEINRAPETAAASPPVNTEIAERIAEFGDIDEFAFTSATDADFNVFFQGSTLPPTQLEVIPSVGTPFPPMAAVPTDTGLFQHASGRFHVSAGDTFTLRASDLAGRQVTDTGSYRFYVYRVDPLPEHVATNITPGDTISGESIDLPGDIDEFSFSAAAGTEFNVLFQPQVVAGAVLRAEVSGPAGAVTSVEGYGPAADLFHLVTGRFTVPSSGTYRIRVSGAGSTTPLDTGPYRLFLYQVNRDPESVPQVLAFGDSVTSEAIDLPGDIDEFMVTVPDSSGAVVLLQIDTAAGIGEWVRATVYPPVGDSLGYVDLNAAGTPRSVDRLHLGPGTHMIRVEAKRYDNRSVIRTRYGLWVYPFQFEPEAAADTFAVGDTVAGESINVPGDVDRFHFYGTRGQLVNIALQGMSAASNGRFELWLLAPDPYMNPFLFVQTPTAAAALGDHQTTRLDLPFTGWYHIEIKGSSTGGSQEEMGPYRFAVEALDPGPEHVNATLAPGDSVTTESIDALGDWDQFTITATPGDEIALVFSAAAANGSYAQALVFDSATGETFFELAGTGTWQTGPILVPGSGRLALAVRENAYTGRFCVDATCGGLFHFVGPYQLSVVRVNRAPEVAPATYAVGDTVRGEAIAPIGDIDEFTGTAVPGTPLTVFYRMAAATVPPGGSIQLQVIDPATQTVLVGNDYAAVNTAFFTPGSFTVPASGNFLVRIRAYFPTSVTTVPYEFVIKP